MGSCGAFRNVGTAADALRPQLVPYRHERGSGAGGSGRRGLLAEASSVVSREGRTAKEALLPCPARTKPYGVSSGAIAAQSREQERRAPNARKPSHLSMAGLS